MNPLYAKSVIVLANVLMIAIRAPHGRRSRETPVAKSRKGAMEVVLLKIALATYFLTLVWVATPFLAFADYPLHPVPFCAGALCMAIGMWLFRQSHNDLGANFSMSLEMRKRHQLVTHGIYRHIRHPMYLAFFVYLTGQSLVLPNWLAGPADGVAMLLLFAFRVGPEERMMFEEFGTEYGQYMAATGRLTPRLRSLRRW
ncbi:MAG TPA: protein-S-isoprenylcysteine O-methyltransferase [Pirellulales bacterium]|nr:protein-S-isoprenylcysteine O-methyltransferase [Pirellulales bacterium]